MFWLVLTDLLCGLIDCASVWCVVICFAVYGTACLLVLVLFVVVYGWVCVCVWLALPCTCCGDFGCLL